MFRVHLRSHLDLTTSTGRDSLGLAKSLGEFGMYVTLDPATVRTPLPHEVAQLLTRAPEPPFDILIHQLPLHELGLRSSEAADAYRKIAWTTQADILRVDPVPATRGYDEVVAQDPETASLLADRGILARVVPVGFDPDPWAVEDDRDWHEEPLQVGVCGSAPEPAIEAVRELSASRIPVRLNLLGENQSDRQRLLFHLRNHVFLDSWGHRNSVALEAGTTGCALVLADTGWSRQWALEDFTYFLTPAADASEIGAALAALAQNRAETRQLGLQASRILPRTLPWERSVRALLQTDTGL